MVNPGRNPELDPIDDPARPVYPGSIERDVINPDDPIDPRTDPRMRSRVGGLAGATVAVAVVLLAILAFSFFGGSGDQARAPEGTGPVIEGTDNPPTGSITPDPAPAPVAPAEQ